MWLTFGLCWKRKIEPWHKYQSRGSGIVVRLTDKNRHDKSNFSFSVCKGKELLHLLVGVAGHTSNSLDLPSYVLGKLSNKQKANGKNRKTILKQPILMSRKLIWGDFLHYNLVWLGILYKQLSESDTSEEKAITSTIAFDVSEVGSLRDRVFSAHTTGTVSIASNLGNASNRAILAGMDTWKKESCSNFPTHAVGM